MLAARGPELEHYNWPLDRNALYRFVVDNALTPDTIAVIGHTGGTVGNWLRIRENTRGTDLVDGAATIQVGGNYWRVLPAATLSGNSVLTLGTTNASSGDIITITRLDTGAFTYAVANGGAGAGTLVTFPVSVEAFGDFQFDGTNWSKMRAAQMLT